LVTSLLELLEHHRRDLLGGILLAFHDDSHAAVAVADLEGHHLHLLAHLVVSTTHETLDGVDGVLGVGHALSLGDLTHQTLTALGESHHGRCGPIALGIGDNLGLGSFHQGHHAVGGTQIDSDNLAHPLSSWFLLHFQWLCAGECRGNGPNCTL